jgi:hypothetical protein
VAEEAASLGWFGAVELWAAVSFFLQVGKLTAKNKERRANRMSIN